MENVSELVTIIVITVRQKIFERFNGCKVINTQDSNLHNQAARIMIHCDAAATATATAQTN